MLDMRDIYLAQSDRIQFHSALCYPARAFGFQDVALADDTNLVHTRLSSLRILGSCYLREAWYYDFSPTMHPNLTASASS